MIRLPHIIFDVQSPDINKFCRSEHIFEPIALINEQGKLEMLRALLSCVFG
ncbi:MAG: hypothetical protein ACOX1Q_11310 [Eubacteriales bacterium]